MEQVLVKADVKNEAVASAFSRALAAADGFRGATSPNPPVGCSILDATGRILVTAAHERAGEAHAEAKAISLCRAAGTLGQAHTLVVTLEPCNHTGRTPPCCNAILNTNIRSVWIGMADPNPAVKGGGAERLAAAGLLVRWIEAIDSVLAAQARDQLSPFAKHVRQGIPWITIKQALDSSGSMIPPAGQTTFTSPSSLELAHRLRKRADAILTGSGTILADSPQFSVRHVPDHAGKVRGLYILDRRCRVPASYRDAAETRGFRPWSVSSPEDALRHAHAAGALEVLVEAGPTLTGHMLEQGLWDEHIIIRKDALGPGRDSVERRLRSQ